MVPKYNLKCPKREAERDLTTKEIEGWEQEVGVVQGRGQECT